MWTADGHVLIDWTMALGAVGLGYAHPAVVEAVQRAVREGGVGPLPPTLEVEIAERLVSAYPGAEQARFFKTGAEGVQAAVRVARVATGRERVVHCGYHGWLDGPTGGAGVPSAVARLWTPVPFDDAAALERACGEGEPPAAILLEPVIERAPQVTWLQAARALATERGSVLVLDEIKTAFRLAKGGAAERWGVGPDLAVLGKALANGYPLAAVVGRADLMARLSETWVSSTLATEFVSLAAAGAVLDVWEREDVAGRVGRIGGVVMQEIRKCVVRGAWDVLGMPEMWMLRFRDAQLERRFLVGCAARGVLLKRGAYNFPSLAHGEAEVEATMDAVRAALAQAGA
ncbi:MAG: aminotransferase class III-fold pyridoxal phosphate-dependent enzyme [Gemmatimonadetes bacterium]|nr:aminotransferase class III-fold pyridoxal phosphate-dependent enzyme [Gemmatimonadota bacterium]